MAVLHVVSDGLQLADGVSHDAPCVHEVIDAQARRHPNHIAVSFQQRTLTYAQLVARANRLAVELIERGCGPDSLIGIAVDRSLEMVVAMLAIVKAGAAYVPLDPAFPDDRLKYMVSDAGLT